MYIFYLDLLVGKAVCLTAVKDFVNLVTYTLFFGIVVHYYGLPLHIIRDLYMTLRSFLSRCRDLILYRRATANMNQRYPTATISELATTDRTCIICREEMTDDLAAENQDAAQAAGPGHPKTPKKLPCGIYLLDKAVLMPRPLVPYELSQKLAGKAAKLSDMSSVCSSRRTSSASGCSSS